MQSCTSVAPAWPRGVCTCKAAPSTCVWRESTARIWRRRPSDCYRAGWATTTPPISCTWTPAHFAPGAVRRGERSVAVRGRLPAAMWLLAAAGCTGGTAPGAGAPPNDAGAKIYAQNCVPCHREDGAGVPNVYPSLMNSPVVNGDPQELARWVLAGKRPRSLPLGRYSTQMLLFGWLKDDDAAALLSYVRSHFGNASPPVDAGTIAQSR